MNIRMTLGVMTLAALLAGTVQAGPFDPAYRGQPNSVHAIFDWVSLSQAPWDTTLFQEGPGATFPLDNTVPPGATDNGIDTTVTLPNYIDPLPLKLIRLQLFFDGPVPLNDLEVDFSPVDPTGPVQTTEVVRDGDPILNVYYIDFELRPNPDRERFVIFGNETSNIVPGNLLRLEIDTISIPEPTSLALLATGALAFLRRR